MAPKQRSSAYQNPMSSSASSSSTSPYSSLISLLREAFSFANRHSWIANFLFVSDPVPISDVVTGLQQACAPLVDLQFPSNSAFPPSQKHVALLPLFSNEHLTVGLRLQVVTRSNNRQYVVCSKFVFDNVSTSLLSVSDLSNRDRIVATFMSHSFVQGRTFACMKFRAETFRRAVTTESISAAVLLNALVSATICTENKNRCETCNTSREDRCRCRHVTSIPRHPMHFEALAPNVLLYAGNFSGRMLNWRRGRNEVLTQDIPTPTTCRVSVSVHARRVAAVCNLPEMTQEV